MKKLNRKNTGLEQKLPIKILQFGEGNFLRAFADYAFHLLNKNENFEAGIAVIKPREKGSIETFIEQEGLYTLFQKGYSKGEIIDEHELIDCIQQVINPHHNFEDYIALARLETLEFIITNVTEAGIVYIASDTPTMQPPSSIPAKIAVFLYERFKYFKGDSTKGLTIIPSELLTNNAEVLKEILLHYIDDWDLEDGFRFWLLNSCSFHNTLVDRIVPGYPHDDIELYTNQLDYEDKLIVSAEPYFLWAIEGDANLKEKLPFHKIGLDVKIVKDIQPYRALKIRILNGAHTSMVPFSILFGNSLVKETIENEFTGSFVRKLVYNEILETIDMDTEELVSYADEVFDRFSNPFIKHNLSSIALYAVSKFKVRALPSILEYESKNGKLPTRLTFALACLIRFYKGTWQGKKLPIDDDVKTVAAFSKIWELSNYEEIAEMSLKNEQFWDDDLTKVKSLTAAIIFALREIDTNGIEKGFVNFSKQY